MSSHDARYTITHESHNARSCAFRSPPTVILGRVFINIDSWSHRNHSSDATDEADALSRTRTREKEPIFVMTSSSHSVRLAAFLIYTTAALAIKRTPQCEKSTERSVGEKRRIELDNEIRQMSETDTDNRVTPSVLSIK